jgi:integrase
MEARFLKECELDYRRMYEMRHTCATNLLMSGQYSVNEIASILGHSTPQMLFERYTRNISAERKLQKTEPFGHL